MESTGKRGRPRSMSSRAAILRAAFEILCAKGYVGMSIEAVAERSGSSKATIYRWWDARADLAVEAFFTATRTELAFPDSGSAREDFRLQIQQLAELLRGRPGKALAAMIAGASTDPAMRRSIVQRWVLPRKRWGYERMVRAQAEGELRPDVDLDAALDLLYGPLYARLLVRSEVPTKEEVASYLALALRTIFFYEQRR